MAPRWRSALAWLTEPSPEVRAPAERRQARTLAALFLVLPFLAMLGLIAQVWVDPSVVGAAEGQLVWLLLTPVGYGLARSRLYAVGVGLLVLLPLAAAAQAIVGHPEDPALFVYLLVPVALAGGLLEARRIAFVAALVLAVAAALGTYAAPTLGPAATVRIGVAFGFMMLVLLAAQAQRIAVEAERRNDLAMREALARRILEASFGGLAVVRDGVIREANVGFVHLFGTNPEGVVGHPLQEFLPEVRLDTKEAGAAPVETSVRRADGTFVPVAMVSRPDSSPTGVEHVVAIQDLSDRDALRARLHQADRMAVMGQLAAGVAHEINNPLTWVIGNLERLAAGLDGDLRQAAEQAAEGARRVRRIARDLDTFARAREGPIVALDLGRVARSAANLVRHDVTVNGRLEEEYAAVPSIDGDPTRTGQVCLNLLANAAQAIAGGAGRTVRLQVGTDASGRAFFAVEDDGPGIPAELQGRIFEPFFSTREHGTGLGLAICKSLVQEMGGEIFLDSVPGRGTRIGFAVPAGKLLLAPGNDDDTGEVEQAPQRRARVLIIDDEPAICELLQSALTDHDVTVAPSGEEGRARALEAVWDVILCDLMMPGVSGIDIHEALAASAPGRERRLVFLTGGAFTATAREFLDRVENQVMFKPFRLARIRDVVSQALASQS